MPKPDPAREWYWRAVVADSTASGLSRAEYCRRHSINVMTLRNWMKRLKQRDAAAATGQSPKSRGRNQRKRIAAKRKIDSVDRSLPVNRHHQPGVEFAEVRLVDSEEPADKQGSITEPLEIVFPSNLTLRLVHGVSLKSLSALLTFLENR